jgi:hypothetical protein
MVYAVKPPSRSRSMSVKVVSTLTPPGQWSPEDVETYYGKRSARAAELRREADDPGLPTAGPPVTTRHASELSPEERTTYGLPADWSLAQDSEARVRL